MDVMRIFEANGAEACADCGRRGMAERDRLLAENAKLEELVRGLYDDLKRGPEPPDWIGERRLDMQELGIEVE